MKRIITVIVVLLTFRTPLLAENIDQRLLERQPPYVDPTISAITDVAVGIMDKGQIENVISNFGLLSQFHFFSPAIHWPRSGSDTQYYGFGFGFFLATEDNVIESVTSSQNPDWQPIAGSADSLFGTATVPAENDDTPLMACSDLVDTWPTRDGIPFWPGKFRLDPISGETVAGEFASDRDIYGAFDDRQNPTGSSGFRVDQMAYCYGRNYAEDFHFFEFTVTNTRAETSPYPLYLGYIADFMPDFDNHDLLKFDEERQLIYLWDADGIPQNGWSSVGYIGLGILQTTGPGTSTIPITDFHYFDDEFSPVTDEQWWPIISSDPDDPDITAAHYFHGENSRLDNDALVAGLDPTGGAQGTDITFVAASKMIGPIPAGQSRKSVAVLVLGEDEADLLHNFDVAKGLFENIFQGPTPPPAPNLTAYQGDGQITLTWDLLAETATDQYSGQVDFEGYKIYRSNDGGQTWGDIITDELGRQIGYVPIARYDLINEITTDAVTGQIIGFESGLPQAVINDVMANVFVDTDLINGVQYTYAVTAYDRGDADLQVSSLESGYSGNTGEPNVVRIVPSAPAGNSEPGHIVEGVVLEPIGGLCESTVELDIVFPDLVKDALYELSFERAGLDTGRITLFNLVNRDTGDTLIYRSQTYDVIGNAIPIIDGFRVKPMDLEPAITEFGWSHIQGDTCTFDWWTEKRPGTPFFIENAPLYGSADFRITVVDPANGSEVMVDGAFGGVYGPVSIPIQVHRLNDDGSTSDVSEHTWLIDYRYDNPDDSLHYGPAGWDLIPGGAGYNPNTPDNFNISFPDELSLSDNQGNRVNIRTQNGPKTATPPTIGDQFTVRTRKRFRPGIRYEFNARAASAHTPTDTDLEKIRVVPNPYVVSAAWETSVYERKLMFNRLPDQCYIHIFTVAGDQVITLDHNLGSDRSMGEDGFEFWDLRSESDLDVAYGLYIYVVETVDGRTKQGKFAIVR